MMTNHYKIIQQNHNKATWYEVYICDNWTRVLPERFRVWDRCDTTFNTIEVAQSYVDGWINFKTRETDGKVVRWGTWR